MEYVEGAAYVSQSRGEAYIGKRGVNGAYALVDDEGEYVEDRALPDDLVCIWAPGDPLPTRIIPASPTMWKFDPPVKLTPGEYLMPFAGIPGVRAPRGGMNVTAAYTGSPPPSFWHPADPHPHEQVTHPSAVADGVRYFLNQSGFFYPTRYNERPGRYEDERTNKWRYDPEAPSGPGNPSGPRWSLEKDPNGWFEIPVTLSEDTNLMGYPIAVRWIGGLDE